MKFYADTSFVGNLYFGGQQFSRRTRVHVNPVSHAEFLSRGHSAARQRTLARVHFARGLNFQDSARVAALRQQRAKQGKPLSTPDVCGRTGAPGFDLTPRRRVAKVTVSKHAASSARTSLTL